MGSKPTPLKAYVKCRTSDNRILSFQILLWPGGGVTLELSERKDSGFWCIDKGHTTIGQVYDFWRYLGRVLAKQGVSTQAILNDVIGLDLPTQVEGVT